MPDKDQPTGKQQSDDKKSPDTAEVAFDEIIDAILGADPAVVRERQKRRKKRKQSTD
jgi:hypothetical protein